MIVLRGESGESWRLYRWEIPASDLFKATKLEAELGFQLASSSAALSCPLSSGTCSSEYVTVSSEVPTSPEVLASSWRGPSARSDPTPGLPSAAGAAASSVSQGSRVPRAWKPEVVPQDTHILAPWTHLSPGATVLSPVFLFLLFLSPS